MKQFRQKHLTFFCPQVRFRLVLGNPVILIVFNCNGQIKQTRTNQILFSDLNDSRSAEMMFLAAWFLLHIQKGAMCRAMISDGFTSFTPSVFPRNFYFSVEDPAKSHKESLDSLWLFAGSSIVCSMLPNLYEKRSLTIVPS
ncbi:hypothetical protein [Planococcus lenghuensis]|uniref:hypothetical protein n=1 Tax=Planococcus lenghuensis TaxID=2213202 RepID=UPI0012EC003D|nr:hypothetical protein [Planococcus lenghuensis]